MASQPPFFDLDEPEYEPLEMSPQAPPQRDTKSQWIKLALIAPLLAKGGPGALEGFLSGMNAARQRDEVRQRQYNLDTDRVNQQNQLAQYRQDTLAGQQQSRQQALLKQYADAIGSASSPDEVQAIRQAYVEQGRAIGMRPGPFETLAMTQTPTALQRKQAEKRVAMLKSQHGEKWMETGARFTYDMPGDPEPIPFQELLRRSGMTPDPNAPPVAPVKVPNTDKRGFTTKDVTVNGKRMLAGFDPDLNQYFAPGDTTTPLTGDIQEYTPPPAPPSVNQANTRRDTRVDRVWNAFNAHPIVKEYNEVQAQTGIIQRVVDGQWSGPSDMAIVFAFMKALDPNSVVRETEYANAAKSGNIFAGWAARFNGAINPNGGFLSEQVRQDFLRTVKSRMDVKTVQYRNLRGQLAKRIDRIMAGAPETGDEALVEYETGADAGTPTPASPNTTGRTKGPAIDLGGGISVRPK